MTKARKLSLGAGLCFAYEAGYIIYDLITVFSDTSGDSHFSFFTLIKLLIMAGFAVFLLPKKKHIGILIPAFVNFLYSVIVLLFMLFFFIVNTMDILLFLSDLVRQWPRIVYYGFDAAAALLLCKILWETFKKPKTEGAKPQDYTYYLPGITLFFNVILVEGILMGGIEGAFSMLAHGQSYSLLQLVNSLVLALGYLLIGLWAKERAK